MSWAWTYSDWMRGRPLHNGGGAMITRLPDW